MRSYTNFLVIAVYSLFIAITTSSCSLESIGVRDDSADISKNVNSTHSVIQNRSIHTRIHNLLQEKSVSNKNNAIIAIKAFDYAPSIYENCMTKNFSITNPVKKNVVIKDCLFQSRIEMVARYSVANTMYANDKLTADVPDIALKDKIDNTSFYVSMNASIESVVEKIAKIAKYSFAVIGQSPSQYKARLFESKDGETPLEFLSRIDDDFDNIAISIDINKKSVWLTFLYSSEMINDNSSDNDNDEALAANSGIKYDDE